MQSAYNNVKLKLIDETAILYRQIATFTFIITPFALSFVNSL